MSQISPPIRILLVAAVGLIAAWMLFLKPSSSSTAPTTPAAASSPTAPGVKGLTSAIDKAHAAAATQQKSDAAVQSATGGSDAAKSPAAVSPAVQDARKAIQGASTTGKVAAHDLPLSVLKAVAAHKVMVLLFWDPDSADDRAVKAAVDKADKWNGEVFFHTAPIKSISDYGRISRGADVEQSPTVVVVDRKLQATRLVGYVDTQTIDQAVVDARRASGVLVTGNYMRSVNQLCSSMTVTLDNSNLPGKPSQVEAYLTGATASIDRFNTRFASLKAPARYSAFKAATNADLKTYSTNLRGWGKAVGKHPTLASVTSANKRFAPAINKSARSLNARMDKHHLLACGSNG